MWYPVHMGVVNRSTIWALEQAKPSLVAEDLAPWGVPSFAVHETLLKRGIYKWLAARRDIIKLKNRIRERLRVAHEEVRKHPRNSRARKRWQGRIETLEWVLREIRAITHSSRWRAPDNDEEAQRYLALFEGHHESAPQKGGKGGEA